MHQGNLHLISCKFVRTLITSIHSETPHIHEHLQTFCPHLNITSPLETQQFFAHLEVLRFEIPVRLTILLRLILLVH